MNLGQKMRVTTMGLFFFFHHNFLLFMSNISYKEQRHKTGVYCSIIKTTAEFNFMDQFIVNFLKNVTMDTQLLISTLNLLIFSFSPCPPQRHRPVQLSRNGANSYLSLPNQKTLAIEPWEVLFAMKGESICNRTYSYSLLSEVTNHWNIVYWTDLIPDKIDDLLEKSPQKSISLPIPLQILKRQVLWRIGCDVQTTIIIDRKEINFEYDRYVGIELPRAARARTKSSWTFLNFFSWQCHQFPCKCSSTPSCSVPRVRSGSSFCCPCPFAQQPRSKIL